ncbi:hypothetical protein [Boudabousia marimammalium]|uniref:Anaphase-promoting complex subunit 5 domain-containing protein n=1 Tax=Boudabousia marimammalium TaxID=156892 RepID=A0A1Q5PRZ0_9ACTO|nr:hypothetical protein [Boudabousia marimammalium]OKL50341.1 hypothetical protein BM477_02875 [Boudabousia marimammalium]
MRDEIEIENKLEEATGFPWGPARSAAIAEAVTWADEGEYTKLQIRGRIDLINAYLRGGQDERMIAPFVWLLNLTEQHPEDSDDDVREMVRWFFKTAVTTLANNPSVSLQQIDRLLEQMHTYYLADGASLHAYYRVHAQVDMICGRMESAEEYLNLWRSSTRDENSDCLGCDPLQEIIFFDWNEQWDETIASGLPSIAETDTCEAQPFRTQTAVLDALSRTGRAASAWECHLSSWRAMRSDVDDLVHMGRHLTYLGRLEATNRSLRAIREVLPFLSETSIIVDTMWFTAGLTVALESLAQTGHGDEKLGVRASANEPVGFPGLESTLTVAEALPIVRDTALTIAKQFDERNGNDSISKRVNAIFDAPHYPDAGKNSSEIFSFIEAEKNPLPKMEGIPQLVSASLPLPEDAPDYPLPTYNRQQVPHFDSVSELVAFEIKHRQDHRIPEYATFYKQLEDKIISLMPDSYDDITDPEELYSLASVNYGLLQREVAKDLYERGAENADDPVMKVRLEIEAHDTAFDMETEGKYAILEWLQEVHDQVFSLAREALPVAEQPKRGLRSLFSRSAEPRKDETDPFISLQVAERFYLLMSYQKLASSVNDYEKVDEALALEKEIASRYPVLESTYQLSAARDLLSRGKVYDGAIAADQAMHLETPDNLGHQIQGRLMLAKASEDVHDNREASVQIREALTLASNAGLRMIQGSLGLYLARMLAAQDRDLEAAEVLEEVLEEIQTLGHVRLIAVLRHYLVGCLDTLGEHDRVVQEARKAVKTMVGLGDYDAAIRMLMTAAEALQRLERSDEAAETLREREEMMAEHVEDSEVKTLNLARAKRRRARTLVMRVTPRVAEQYLDEALSLLDDADALVRTVKDDSTFSQQYELGDSMDDRAYVLWRCDRNGEAAELFQQAAENYLIRDREEAVRALVYAANIYVNELRDAVSARAAIARIEEIFAHPRWKNHAAWETVNGLKEQLEEM